MKYLLSVLYKFILITLLSFSAFAELKEGYAFVPNPTATPFKIKGKTKYYLCEGYVRKDYLDLAFTGLNKFSEAYNIPPPTNKNLCTFNISKLLNGRYFSVQYYLNSQSMFDCTTGKKACENTREMTFIKRGNATDFSYMFWVNNGLKWGKSHCITDKGKVVDAC